MLKLIKRSKEKGIGVVSAILGIVILGFFLVYLVPIGVGFFEMHTIKKGVEKVIEEQNGQPVAIQMKNSIIRMVDINGIDVKPNDIEVKVVGREIFIDVEYIKSIEISERIQLMMDLSVTMKEDF